MNPFETTLESYCARHMLRVTDQTAWLIERAADDNRYLVVNILMSKKQRLTGIYLAGYAEDVKGQLYLQFRLSQKGQLHTRRIDTISLP